VSRERSKTAPPDCEPALAGFADIRRFWDPMAGLWNAQVFPGDFYVSRADEVITTVLGSCVSACVRDPALGLGGINHFMLPVDPDPASAGASARYGAFALERLINELVKHGGARNRLEVKVFGGGKVMPGASDIGQANIAFVRTFFATEGLPIVAEDVGEQYARRLRYRPRTGQVMIHRLPMSDAKALEEREQQLRQAMAARLKGPDPELF
jgi:chemotaxis protein CheD